MAAYEGVGCWMWWRAQCTEYLAYCRPWFKEAMRLGIGQQMSLGESIGQNRRGDATDACE